MRNPLNVLIVEDRVDDAELIVLTLQRHGIEVNWHRVDTPVAFQQHLGPDIDVILADYHLAGWTGMDAFEMLRREGYPIPFILVTGELSDELVTTCIRAGIADYVHKEHLERLPIVVRNVLARHRAEQERHQAERQVRQLLEATHRQAQQMQQILATIPVGVLLLDEHGRIEMLNPRAQEHLEVLTGKSIEVGETLTALANVPIEEIQFQQRPWKELLVEGDPPKVFEIASRYIENTSESGRWVLLLRDVTQRRQQMRGIQEQERLAAVGQLAAGIAHDFNNILTGILGFGELALARPGLTRELRQDLQIILEQGRRAAQLIRQILDFSRASATQPQPLALDSLLKESIKLFQRTLPETIHIELLIDPGSYPVHADPVQIQQVLSNLVLNARDAMPDGGTLTVRLTQRAFPSESEAPVPGMAPGPWICLMVQDTGCGIPEEIRSHVFEPFFTTKEREEGTGLGLAQVYGIVRQHRGFIHFDSVVGSGSTFYVYLPPLERESSEVSLDSSDLEIPRGVGELILVVEDEAIVRQTVQSMLESLGYRTVGASNGREALDVYRRHQRDLRLVLTDLIMPEMGGRALLESLASESPELPGILMSGYPLESSDREYLSQRGVQWLAKPVMLPQLARVVREALTRESPPSDNSDREE